VKQPLFFRIYKNGQLAEIKQIQAEQVIIGSNDEAEIQIKDASVSPIHAMVEERESGFFVCDLGSATGTEKNGQKILDVAIQSGDQLTVGDYTIEFFVGVPKPKSKPPRTAGEETSPKIELEAPAQKTVTPAPKQEPKPLSAVSKPEVKVEPKSEPAPKAMPQPTPKSSPVAQPARTAEKAFAGLSQYAPASSEKNRGKWGATFAPPSHHKDLKKVIKPGKGTFVEVTVAWKERILSTYHYADNSTVRVGSHPKNDIVLPVFGSSSVSHPLLKVEGAAKVFLTSDMTGELVVGDQSTSLADLVKKGRTEAGGAGYFVTLQQNEMLRVEIGSSVSVYVRYVNHPPKPAVVPFLDLSTFEISVLLGTLVLGALFALLLIVYTPVLQEEPVAEVEPQRKAVFIYKSQIDPIDDTREESKPSENAKLAEKKTSAQEKSPIKSPDQNKAASREDEGKAAEAAPNKSKSQEVKLTTPNAGKSTGVQKSAVANRANKPDAQGGQQKDVKKSGILSVLSGRGAQDRLSQVYSGAGVVGGLGQTATGSGAQSAVGAGDVPGEGLKDIGKGGTGEASIGIAGVNTRGRGSGNQGYGLGGLGDKKNANVQAGGAEESFSGTIDREAIRRVILQNINQFKSCYERALNRDPSLSGKIVLKWSIVDKGRVGEAGVGSSTMGSSEVEQCTVRVLRTLRFPEPPAGQVADVQYPFVFAPTN
jgi:pSer/pThr/pTyr-binding forkhead associated (FHA) protein